MIPANQRKAAERQRRRAAGFVPLEVWVQKDHVSRVRAFVAALKETADAKSCGNIDNDVDM
jgi:hypothetical protein